MGEQIEKSKSPEECSLTEEQLKLFVDEAETKILDSNRDPAVIQKIIAEVMIDVYKTNLPIPRPNGGEIFNQIYLTLIKRGVIKKQ